MSNSLGRMVQWHDGRFGFEASPFRKELIAADTGSIPVETLFATLAGRPVLAAVARFFVFTDC